MYTDPINRHLNIEPKEVGEDTLNNNLQREQKQDNGNYEPIENKETMFRFVCIIFFKTLTVELYVNVIFHCNICR